MKSSSVIQNHLYDSDINIEYFLIDNFNKR